MIYFCLVLALLFIPRITHAVPPPEFIIQITSQIVPIFGWIFALLLTTFTVSFQFIRRIVAHKYIMIAVVVIGLFFVSWGTAYVIDLHLQTKQLTEATKQVSVQTDEYVKKIEEKNKLEEVRDDASSAFIRSYYEHIAHGELQAAYSMTPKDISYEEFKFLYKSVTNIRVEKVEKMNVDNYSVRIVLVEGFEETPYGILITLTRDEKGNPIALNSADIVELGNGTTSIDTSTTHEITNQAFSKIIHTTSTIFVLDAREQVEYEYGHFPSSTHIKFADLDEGGQWAELPKDTPIYVFCWSGIRGSMVTTFLRSKGLDVYFLKDGAKGWVESGGAWEGEISFGAVYEAERYSKLFLSDQVRKLRKEGTILIDSREPLTVKAHPIEGSIPLRIMYTPTKDMDSVLSTVPANSTVITVCDNYVNCFDARLAGIELERRGNTFLGRTIYTGVDSL